MQPIGNSALKRGSQKLTNLGAQKPHNMREVWVGGVGVKGRLKNVFLDPCFGFKLS